MIVKNIEKKEFSSIVFEDFNEQYMYFFAIALFFFILEMLIGNRKTAKNIFK